MTYDAYVCLRHSFLDILELKRIQEFVKETRDIESIDFHSIVASYKGHTMFSIFSRSIEAFDDIHKFLDQYLVETDFGSEKNIDRMQLRCTLRQHTKSLKSANEEEWNKVQTILQRFSCRRAEKQKV